MENLYSMINKPLLPLIVYYTLSAIPKNCMKQSYPAPEICKKKKS